MGGAGMKKPRTEKLVHLLEDLIVEILTRLPSKSLLRFKCVSKRWRLLISGKPFIRRHLKQSSIDPDMSLHHLIARPLPDPSMIWSCPLRSIFDEERPPSNRNLQSMYDESNTFGSCNYLRYLIYGGDGGDGNGRFFMRILGSCNGLILVSGPFPERCCLLVWNPAIRKANTIPAPAPPHEQVQVVGIPLSDYQMKREHYCIGYDECADEYKVVHILITRMVFHDRRQITSCSQTRIYSSRTRSWKEIESSHGAVARICDYLGKFVNGRLHWMAFEDDNNNYLNRKVVVKDIVCLDLVGEEEKYEIMGGPEYLSIHDGSEPVLKDLGGYLSLICLTSTSEINVSVMMKYGDHRSWTNILTLVDFDQNPTMETNIPRAMPLWLKKNGDMAVYFGPGVVIYNGNYKSHKSPVDTQFNSAIDSVTYVESLVSPFGK